MSDEQSSHFMQISKEDFSKAYWKGFWRAILSRVRRSDNNLLPFDEVRKRIPMRGQYYRGLQQIPTEKIVGSVNRFHDFDRAFLPRQTHTRSRWESIDRAYFADVILPPIDVYKVGEVYFVKDGNHRVSVAKERGQAYMDAYVIEIDVPGVIDENTKIDDLIQAQEYVEFLNETRLDQYFPGENFQFSIPGQYEKVIEHINVHRWYMGIEKKRPIEYPEAVKGWYKDVYRPLVKIIRKKEILKKFPHRTEMDLYLWIIEHRYYLSEEHERNVSLETAALHFADLFSKRPFRHLQMVWDWITKKLFRKGS